MKKAVTLIIVIFLMMMLSLLGITLLRMRSGDFEFTRRSLNSERALYLAESGAEWAMYRVYEEGGTCDLDGDGNNINLDTEIHTLDFGQYSVTCTCEDDTCGSGLTTIDATGYIPDSANPESQRTVRTSLTVGGLEFAVFAQEQFDWHLLHTGSDINGDIGADEYNGDDDAVFNELGEDYDPLPLPVLPSGDSESDRGFGGVFPTIDMSFFATTWWTVRFDSARTGVIASKPASDEIRVNQAGFFDDARGEAVRNLTLDSKAEKAHASSNGNSLVVNTDSFFTGTEGKIVKNLDHMQPHGWSDDDWAIIQGVQDSGRTAILNKNIGNEWDNDYIKVNVDSWDDDNWAAITQVKSNGRVAVLDKDIDSLWSNGDIVHITKRINRNWLFFNWYVNGDVIFDVRSRNVDLHWTSVIAEGDMVVKGDRSFTVRTHILLPKYPVLGTKLGQIISLDTPSGGSDTAKRNKRNVTGLMYTQYGDIQWNYLDGVAAYGTNIAFDGLVDIDYDPRYIDPYGFTFSLSTITWQEK